MINVRTKLNRSFRFLVAILAIVAFSACSAAGQVRQLVHDARAAYEEIEPLIPQDRYDQLSSTLTREALELGEVATDIWAHMDRNGRPPIGYNQWIEIALQGFGSLLEILEREGIEVPQEVEDAILGLAVLLRGL